MNMLSASYCQHHGLYGVSHGAGVWCRKLRPLAGKADAADFGA